MKTLKALVVPFAIFIGLSTAVAVTVNLQQVNDKVSELAKPYNTATTVVNFVFTSLNIDTEKTLDFGFTGLVSKKGTVNDAKVEFKKAQYTYGDGTKPTVDLDIAVTFDLVKALGQETLNELAKVVEQMANEMATSFVKDYGPAVTVDAKVIDRQVDANGNIQGLSMKLTATSDISKLPAAKPVDQLEFLSIDVEASASTTGIALKVNFVANPLYAGFRKDGDGLKEYIEKLLNDDQGTYDELRRYIGVVDGVAQMLVEMKPPQPSAPAPTEPAPTEPTEPVPAPEPVP